jgi:UDP-xylose/UDP-N-acetylglucosamine transporter B4
VDLKRKGFLVPRHIPLSRWTLIVMLFFATSVMNNASLAYNISIPVYIIFRSGGTVITMIMGYFVVGKRFV